LTLLGTAGLSAAGITSGLATAGSIIGGGMVAGIGVLAAPIAALALAGYIIARKIRSAKLAASLNEALGKLYDIQSRLIKNAKYFRDELAQIKTLIDFYEKKGGKLTQ
jgi:hypothetical protein